MNQTSYEAPDFNPEDEAQVSAILENETIRPGELFQGKRLWPFTPGSKGVYASITSEGDTWFFRYLAFIYIHVRRTEADMESDLAKHIIPLIFADSLNPIRAKILVGFRDSLSEEDILAARAIFKKEMDLLRLSEVSATPPESVAGEKKRASVTPRQKPRGKSLKRQKISG